MSNEQPQTDNRSASQKIQDAERGIAQLFSIANELNNEIIKIKEFCKLINAKVSSMVKAIESGAPVNDDTLSRIMTETSCEELAEKVKLMVAQGGIKPVDQVADDSFVVGTELDDAGEVTNPRVQFALFALTDPDNQERLRGTKVGETAVLKSGKFKVLEAYQIQAQSTAQAPETSAPGSAETSAPGSAETAPAAAQPTEAAPESAPATSAESAAPTQDQVASGPSSTA